MAIIKGKRKKETLISKPRKEREVKPKNLLPDIFYKGGIKGYSWCDECRKEVRTASLGTNIECEKSHKRTLILKPIKVEPIKPDFPIFESEMLTILL